MVSELAAAAEKAKVKATEVVDLTAESPPSKRQNSSRVGCALGPVGSGPDVIVID